MAFPRIVRAVRTTALFPAAEAGMGTASAESWRADAERALAFLALRRPADEGLSTTEVERAAARLLSAIYRKPLDLPASGRNRVFVDRILGEAAPTPEMRRELFMALGDAMDEFGWAVPQLTGSGPGEFRHQCSRVLVHLAATDGFWTPATAAEALRQLAHFQIDEPYVGYAWSYGSDTRMERPWPLMRRLTAALPETDDPGTRRHAQEVLRRYTERPGPAGRWVRDTPEAAALRRLAGLPPQPGILERQRGASEPRIALDYDRAESQESWANFLRVLDEVTDLLRDVLHAHGEAGQGGRDPSWMHDAGAFARRFGPPPGWEGPDPRWCRFGWWHADTPCGDILPPLRTKDFHQIRRTTAGRPWVDATRAEELHALRGRVLAALPCPAHGNFLPYADTFRFEGHDPEGLFLDILEDCTGSKPSDRLLRTIDSHIERIGAEAVFAGLKSWAEEVRSDKPLQIDSRDYVPAETFTLMMRETASQLSLGPHRDVLWTDPDPDPRYISRVAIDIMAQRSQWILDPAATGVDAQAARFEERIGQLRKSLNGPISNNVVPVAVGVAWSLSRFGDRAVPLLEAMAREGFGGRRGVGVNDARSVKLGNACLWSLGAIGTEAALNALGRIRRSVRDKGVSRQVDRALAAAGEARGLSLDDMLELSLDDYGFGADGVLSVPFGPHEVRLEVLSSRRAVLSTMEAGARKPKRGISKAALAHEPAPGALDELKRAAKDVPKLLPEARRRLERSLRLDRSWSFADWRERFADHGLARTLADRLIWEIVPDVGDARAAMWMEGAFRTLDGERIAADLARARLRVWHPLRAGDEEVARWRARLLVEGPRQPFVQAWRPVYVPTDAERATATYSNRFAAHVLERAPTVAFLRNRGWTIGEATDGHAELRLPAFGVAAIWWIAGAGALFHRHPDREYMPASQVYVATDRLTFRALDGSGGVSGAPMPIDTAPAMAFSEAMLDLDGAVSLFSVGADRFWTDRGPDAGPPLPDLPDPGAYRDTYARASELAGMRRELLGWIVPRLEFADRLILEGRTLVVQGDLHRYRIDLGSGNVRRSPRDQSVCIQQMYAPPEDGGYIPFEGDLILSLILSKAMLLAKDAKIEDPVIRAQLDG